MASTTGLHVVAVEAGNADEATDSSGVLIFVPLHAMPGHSTVIGLANSEHTKSKPNRFLMFSYRIVSMGAGFGCANLDSEGDEMCVILETTWGALE